ncbi:SDR family oxidoreductase [Halioglobus maricola]|uniref:SDR family oxidoreductase n=1 Tax=Halioglobus maricola TaxID=2601894 RepID=A0A5P9NHW4_9GAMM|nr:SDR family oxidoreductase [Halioglobus maricola]QFU75116.1 SDR family oxidoreductase [Halioglobus maricola]
MSGFDNCVALVTGGASGIGEATVRAIVAHGGRAVIADLQTQRGEALADELGDAVRFIETDVTSEAAVEAAVAEAVSSFGSLTALVNNAGVVGAVGSIADTSVEAYQRTMDIHCKGSFLGVKHAARVMPRGSAIVSLASTAGLIGGQGPHVYTMAKHAIIGLTKSAASELATKGIRVNAVAPSGTVTPMVNALGLGDAEATAAALAAASPLGIACMPEDIADGILFLLSNASRHITGQTLAIDAGLTTAGMTPPPFFDEEPQMLLQAGQREQG